MHEQMQNTDIDDDQTTPTIHGMYLGSENDLEVELFCFDEVERCWLLFCLSFMMLSIALVDLCHGERERKIEQNMKSISAKYIDSLTTTTSYYTLNLVGLIFAEWHYAHCLRDASRQ